MSDSNENQAGLPSDDLSRVLTIASSEGEKAGTHLALAGDTYTILITGKDTAGRFSVIDMYVPPGGGPPSHRHDFEEAFTVLEGEIEAIFRGSKSTLRAGQTINIPANAPHRFRNSSTAPARLLCICSPAGLEELFLRVGTPVATRTTPPPPLDEAAQAQLREKSLALASEYRTEFLPHD